MSEIETPIGRPDYEPPVQGMVTATLTAPTEGLRWQAWKRDTCDPRGCPLQANLGLFFDGTRNNEKQDRDTFKHIHF